MSWSELSPRTSLWRMPPGCSTGRTLTGPVSPYLPATALLLYVPASLGSQPFGSTHLRPREDSFCSSSGPDRNDEYYTHAVLPLYHSLSKARVAVSPPACWGVADPLGVLAFGRLSDDPRHLHAEHHHIVDTTQNITTSFDSKQMHCNNCTYQHHILTRGRDSGSEGVEQKCFILSYIPMLSPGGACL
jgi:hypothetical protein